MIDESAIERTHVIEEFAKRPCVSLAIDAVHAGPHDPPTRGKFPNFFYILLDVLTLSLSMALDFPSFSTHLPPL
jgi:hypothetical protein